MWTLFIINFLALLAVASSLRASSSLFSGRNGLVVRSRQGKSHSSLGLLTTSSIRPPPSQKHLITSPKLTTTIALTMYIDCHEFPNYYEYLNGAEKAAQCLATSVTATVGKDSAEIFDPFSDFFILAGIFIIGNLSKRTLPTMKIDDEEDDEFEDNVGMGEEEEEGSITEEISSVFRQFLPGNGKKTARRRGGGGVAIRRKTKTCTCPQCQGSGQFLSQICDLCEGQGVIEDSLATSMGFEIAEDSSGSSRGGSYNNGSGRVDLAEDDDNR